MISKHTDKVVVSKHTKEAPKAAEPTPMEALKEGWTNPRRFAGNTFAGLEKMKAFEHGKDLTNSARSTFMNCRKKYQFSYVYGLATRRPSIPFLVGGLFHNGLDRCYSNGFKMDLDQEKAIAEKECEKAAQAPGLTPEETDKIWIQSATVFGLLSGYKKQWIEQDKSRWDVIEAEGAFDVELPNNWRYRGKTDLVVRDKKTKAVKLVEHKTTSRLDAGYVAKLPLDNQILGYLWAKNQEKLGIKEVVYNVSRKPSIRLKQSETLDAFAKRLVEEYLLNTSTYYYRETLTFDPTDVQKFSDELFKFVAEIDRCEKDKFYYQNTGQCTAMGICPFMPLCTNGINEETLSMFRVKERAHEELPDEEN